MTTVTTSAASTVLHEGVVHRPVEMARSNAWKNEVELDTWQSKGETYMVEYCHQVPLKNFAVVWSYPHFLKAFSTQIS